MLWRGEITVLDENCSRLCIYLPARKPAASLHLNWHVTIVMVAITLVMMAINMVRKMSMDSEYWISPKHQHQHIFQKVCQPLEHLCQQQPQQLDFTRMQWFDFPTIMGAKVIPSKCLSLHKTLVLIWRSASMKRMTAAWQIQRKSSGGIYKAAIVDCITFSPITSGLSMTAAARITLGNIAIFIDVQYSKMLFCRGLLHIQ